MIKNETSKLSQNNLNATGSSKT